METPTTEVDPAGLLAKRSLSEGYLAIALMYFAQGVPIGLAFSALGAIIRYYGHSVAAVGLTGLAFLPWALKFLWAGPVENACARWGMPRFLWTTQGMIVLSCLALVPFSPSISLYAVIALIVLLNALCATQDIVTNSYAVLRFQGRHAGAANAIQIAGFIAGMLIGGGGLLQLYSALGWQATMLILAILMAVIYLPLLFIPHWRNMAATPAARTPRVRLRDLREHRDLGWALLLALSFKFAGTAVSTLAQPWLLDKGFNLDQVGRLQMSNLVFVAIGGVSIGIVLLRRLGNRRAVLVSMTLSGLLMGTAWALQTIGSFSPVVLYAAFALQSLFEGAMFVTIWALFMNWSSKDRPGTDFTVMQCCEGFGNALAAGMIGGLGQTYGYGSAFAIAWASAAAILLITVICLPRLQLVSAGD